MIEQLKTNHAVVNSVRMMIFLTDTNPTLVGDELIRQVDEWCKSNNMEMNLTAIAALRHNKIWLSQTQVTMAPADFDDAYLCNAIRFAKKSMVRSGEQGHWVDRVEHGRLVVLGALVYEAAFHRRITWPKHMPQMPYHPAMPTPPQPQPKPTPEPFQTPTGRRERAVE